jgi:uncharacterized protein YndB with AHSA1/START domain
MPSEYDWSAFTVHSYYRAPLEAVWQAWSTAEGLESFFIADARSEPATGPMRAPGEQVHAGDRYRWRFLHGLELVGSFREVDPMQRVAFSFGGMETSVDLQQRGDQVEVRLHQAGCRTDPEGSAGDHLNCRSCWVFFLTNLKSVLEHGTDLRDWEAPGVNDAVSVYWAGLA